jgi:PAS domain S-box-containing protein
MSNEVGIDLNTTVSDEELLRQAYYALRVTDVSPSVIYARNEEGKFVFANQSFADLINIPKDSIIGYTINELRLSSEEDHSRWQNEIQIFKSQQRQLLAEEKYLDRKTNELRCFRTIKIPFSDEQDSSKHVLTISTDWTERKRAEDLVRKILEGTSATTADDFFHSLVYELAHALQVRFAFIGQVIEPTRTHIRLLAVYRDGEFTPNEEYALAETPTERILQKGLQLYPENIQLEFPNDKHLCKEQIVSYMGVPLVGRGVNGGSAKILGILSVMDSKPMVDWAPARWILRIFAARAGAEIERLDNERQKDALQKQLLQAQKMEAIGQLAAGVAHDLNNALGAVVGHLELLNVAARLEPEWRHSVKTALKGCERASSLIDQLLGFSRKGKYNLQISDLRKIIDETLAFLIRVIDKRILIEIKELVSGLTVQVDQAQVQQALTNIILNAAQAMPEGGKIRINISAEKFADASQFNENSIAGDYAVISVKDTGQGIRSENLEKIFEPFFTTKAQGSGSGLGLSMVYGIMQHHGGWVTVDSEQGKGSRFSLYFPCVHTSVPREQLLDPTLRAEKLTGSILLIDDEQMLVDLGVRFLERAGFAPFGFSSASEGMAWFEEHTEQIALAIIDMKMPEIDGKKCFEQLRKTKPNLPIIIMSGYASDEDTQRLLATGDVVFFQKPLKYADLVDSARKLMSGAVSEQLNRP